MEWTLLHSLSFYKSSKGKQNLESINKVFREYLVNFNYFQRMMEDYGFSLIGSEEAKAMGLPNGTGLFDELFQLMKTEIEENYRNKQEYESAHKMTVEEKRISFMNRYFVFRKTHNVNAEKVYNLLVTRDKVDIFNETDDTNSFIESLDKEENKLEHAKNTNVKSSVIIRKIPGKKKKIIIGDEKQINEGLMEINKIEPKKATIVIRKKKN